VTERPSTPNSRARAAAAFAALAAALAACSAPKPLRADHLWENRLPPSRTEDPKAPPNAPPGARVTQAWETQAAPAAVEPKDSPGALARADAIGRSCAAGKRAACLELGRLWERGEAGALRNGDRAAAAYAPLCARGDGEACRFLDGLLDADDTSPKGFGPTLQAFQGACNRKLADGCVGLARMYLEGHGVAESAERSAQLLESACESGSARACDRFSSYVLVGYGVDGDRERGYDLEERACELGSRAACVDIAVRLALGEGVFVDEKRALAMFGEACRKGERRGCVGEAMCHARGLGTVEDVERARTILRGQCEGGFGPACRSLGLMARDGVGQVASRKNAIAWLKRGCDVRDGPSCNAVGEDLHQVREPGVRLRGAPVARMDADFAGARRYYALACTLHDANGCANLGYLYTYGLGVERSVSLGQKYLERGCRLGADVGCAIAYPARAPAL
jgi:uncharacterized protein